MSSSSSSSSLPWMPSKQSLRRVWQRIRRRSKDTENDEDVVVHDGVTISLPQVQVVDAPASRSNNNRRSSSEGNNNDNPETLPSIDNNRSNQHKPLAYHLARQWAWVALEYRCQTHPHEVSVQFVDDNTGDTQLHWTVFGNPPVTVVQQLLRACPELAQTANAQGCLPLHGTSVLRCCMQQAHEKCIVWNVCCMDSDPQNIPHRLVFFGMFCFIFFLSGLLVSRFSRCLGLFGTSLSRSGCNGLVFVTILVVSPTSLSLALVDGVWTCRCECLCRFVENSARCLNHDPTRSSLWRQTVGSLEFAQKFERLSNPTQSYADGVAPASTTRTILVVVLGVVASGIGQLSIHTLLENCQCFARGRI